MISWLPDIQRTTPELLTDVTNLIPTARGYSGVAAAVSAGLSALAATSTGAALILKLDGSTRLFAGTTAALYEGSGSTWTDRSRGGGYSTGDVRWRFAQLGDTSLATNKATQLQASSSGAFANVANSPKATCIETVAGFVMLANCDDTSTGLSTGYGDSPHRWWCSAYGDHTSWAPSVTTQATSGLLIDTQGPIRALKRLGRDVVAYKDRSMYLGRYAGPPTVWQWDLVPGEIGCSSVDGVVSIGFAHLFIGHDDIHLYDGSRPVSIGEGIREWFFNALSKQYKYKIQGLHDYQNRLVIWFYPSGTGDAINSALVYHYPTKRWGHFTRTIESVIDIETGGLTYDQLGSEYSTYDDMPAIAYDSPFWQGGASLPGYLDGDHIAQTLSGDSASSALVTGYVGDSERWSLLARVRPLYVTAKKPTSSTLTAYWVDSLGDAYQSASPTTITSADRYDILQSGRWHKLGIGFTGPHEFVGWTTDLRPQGTE